MTQCEIFFFLSQQSFGITFSFCCCCCCCCSVMGLRTVTIYIVISVRILRWIWKANHIIQYEVFGLH